MALQSFGSGRGATATRAAPDGDGSLSAVDAESASDFCAPASRDVFALAPVKPTFERSEHRIRSARGSLDQFMGLGTNHGDVLWARAVSTHPRLKKFHILMIEKERSFFRTNAAASKQGREGAVDPTNKVPPVPTTPRAPEPPRPGCTDPVRGESPLLRTRRCTAALRESDHAGASVVCAEAEPCHGQVADKTQPARVGAAIRSTQRRTGAHAGDERGPSMRDRVRARSPRPAVLPAGPDLLLDVPAALASVPRREYNTQLLHALRSAAGTVRKLNLSGSRLHHEQVRQLCSGLDECRQLLHLDVSRTGLTDQCAVTVADHLPVWVALRSLNVSWNAIRACGAAALFDSLLEAPCLLELDVSWNSLRGGQQRAMLALQRLLLANTALKHASIAHCHLDQAALDIVQHGLAANARLLGLHVEGNGAWVDANRRIRFASPRPFDPVEAGLMPPVMAPQAALLSAATKQHVCWVCDKWREVVFGFELAEDVPHLDHMWLHLEHTSWEAERMTRSVGTRTFSVHKVVPAGVVRYFFSILSDRGGLVRAEGQCFGCGCYVTQQGRPRTAICQEEEGLHAVSVPPRLGALSVTDALLAATLDGRAAVHSTSAPAHDARSRRALPKRPRESSSGRARGSRPPSPHRLRARASSVSSLTSSVLGYEDEAGRADASEQAREEALVELRERPLAPVAGTCSGFDGEWEALRKSRVIQRMRDDVAMYHLREVLLEWHHLLRGVFQHYAATDRSPDVFHMSWSSFTEMLNDAGVLADRESPVSVARASELFASTGLGQGDAKLNAERVLTFLEFVETLLRLALTKYGAHGACCCTLPRRGTQPHRDCTAVVRASCGPLRLLGRFRIGSDGPARGFRQTDEHALDPGTARGH